MKFDEDRAKEESPVPAVLPFRAGEATVLWVIWLTYGSFYFCRQNIAAAVPGLEAEGLTKTQIGSILGALKIAYAVGQLVNGQLAERTSARLLLALGMLGSAALNVVFGLVEGLYFLIFVWACNGYCQALGWTPCVRVAANWIPPGRRGRAMGIIGTSYQFMAVVTYLIAGWSAHWLGWRGAMYVPAALLALAAVHMLLLLREAPTSTADRDEGVFFEPHSLADSGKSVHIKQEIGLPGQSQDVFSGEPVGGEDSAGRTKFIDVTEVTLRLSLRQNIAHTLSNPALWVLAVSLALLDACRYGFQDWGLSHLQEVQSGHIGMTAVKYAILPAGGILGALFSGWATDRFFHGRRAPVICGLLVLLGTLTLAYDAVAQHSTVGTLFLLFAVGFSIFGPQVLLVGTAPSDLAKCGAAAAAAGFVNFMGYLGAFAGDQVTGYLAEKYDWRTAIYFWAGCAFLGAFVVATLWRVGPRPPASGAA
jgi:OPA family glycerol-3-phosphate transporter-like MFS transporter